MNMALELQNVSAGYEPGQPVLRDITARIEPGDMVGILGPNGAGKTTLFRVLTGLLRPHTGHVRIFGHELQRLTASRRASLIGVSPQNPDGPIPFTVRELVTMSRTVWRAHWWHAPHSAADRHAVDRALALTDLEELRDRPMEALSGGEKQRAIIAMAIAREPPLLLLDEATSHLDMNHRLEIMQIVEKLNREHKVTVLMISHDLNLSADFCRRLLLLDHGRMAADGQPEHVLRADRLQAVYHCDVAVQHDVQRGVLTVNPARRLPSLPDGDGRRCHVIAGGGTASELLRRLALSGYRVSCGVLNAGDSDAATAQALGIAIVLEKPFSPIAAETLAAAGRLAIDCRLCIISEVPFGPGNTANLELAETILKRGGCVLVAHGIEERDYTRDGAAKARVKAMLDGGAQTWQNMTDLMHYLMPEMICHNTYEKEG